MADIYLVFHRKERPTTSRSPPSRQCSKPPQSYLHGLVLWSLLSLLLLVPRSTEGQHVCTNLKYMWAEFDAQTRVTLSCSPGEAKNAYPDRLDGFNVTGYVIRTGNLDSTRVVDGAFFIDETFQQLQVLSITGTGIQAFMPSAAQRLPNLKGLILRNNQIRVFDYGLRPYFENMDMILLGGNPLDCEDDELRWFSRFVQLNPVKFLPPVFRRRVLKMLEDANNDQRTVQQQNSNLYRVNAAATIDELSFYQVKRLLSTAKAQSTALKVIQSPPMTATHSLECFSPRGNPEKLYLVDAFPVSEEERALAYGQSNGDEGSSSSSLSCYNILVMSLFTMISLAYCFLPFQRILT